MKNDQMEPRGLTTDEAKALQSQYGKNELTAQKKEGVVKRLLDIISEPMFLLLIIAAVIYFILGEPRDGLIMLVFVIGNISIEAFRNGRRTKPYMP